MLSFQRVPWLSQSTFCIKELVSKNTHILVNSSSCDNLLKHVNWLESFEGYKKKKKIRMQQLYFTAKIKAIFLQVFLECWYSL